MRTLTKYLRGIATFLYIVFSLPVAVLSVLLLAQAETAQGRTCGLAGGLLFPVPVLLICPFPFPRRRLNAVAAGLAASALALFAALLLV
jgi:hypothetical protein